MNPRALSRRKFLKVAGFTLAGTSLACCGLAAGAAGLSAPKSGSAPV